MSISRRSLAADPPKFSRIVAARIGAGGISGLPVRGNLSADIGSASSSAGSIIFQRAMHRSMRLYPISDGSSPTSRNIPVGESPARYRCMQYSRNWSVYRMRFRPTLFTAGSERR